MDRINLVFKAMINALLGKVEDPQLMLDQTYAELQSKLIPLRQALAEKLATEAQLKRKIEVLESADGSVSKLTGLKKQLKEIQAEIKILRRKYSDLENEVQRVVMHALDKGPE